MDAKEKLLADAKEARSTEEQATRQEEESKHAATLSRTKEQAFSEAKSKEENALEDLRAQEEVASKKRQDLESIAADPEPNCKAERAAQPHAADQLHGQIQFKT